MKKLYEQSPEMQLSGKCQLRHVKCTHHKGYLMEDLSMIKSGFYEISFCKSGDFLFRIGQKRHFITNGDILVIPPDIPHYFTSSDLVANYYDFITVWLEKSYISNLKSQLPALKESVFNIDTPHLLHTTSHEQNSTHSVFMRVCEAWQPLLSLQIYSNNQLQMV